MYNQTSNQSAGSVGVPSVSKSNISMSEAYEALSGSVRSLGEAAGALAKRVDGALVPSDTNIAAAQKAFPPGVAPIVGAIISQVTEIDAIAAHLRSVEARCAL